MNPIAFVKGSDDTIEGLGMPYGGPLGGKDLHREYFDAQTDFCLDWFETRPLLYEHGQDPTTKADVVGRVVAYERSAVGIVTKALLNRRHALYGEIAGLVSDGALGLSSAAMSHLVQVDKKSGRIIRWPWVELSLTTGPANPDAVIQAAKALDAVAGQPAPEVEEVIADAAALVQREARKVFLAKSGRVLSAANRELLARLVASLHDLGPVRDDLVALLEGTDPDASKRAPAPIVPAAVPVIPRLADDGTPGPLGELTLWVGRRKSVLAWLQRTLESNERPEAQTLRTAVLVRGAVEDAVKAVARGPQDDRSRAALAAAELEQHVADALESKVARMLQQRRAA